MSRPGVFICPSCQAVVRGESSSDGKLVCGECQFEFGNVGSAPASQSEPIALATVPRMAPHSPSSKSGGVVRNLTSRRAPIARVVLTNEQGETATSPQIANGSENSSRDEEVILPDGSRRIRRRKKRPKKEKNKTLVLFLVGWLSVLVIAFALFRTGGNSDRPKDVDGGKVSITATRDREFLRKHEGAIYEAFSGYFMSPGIEERIPWIDRSSELARSFSMFYRSHSLVQPQAPIARLGSKVIEVSSDPLVLAVETVWQDAKNRRLGTVHFYDGVGWKLDWEAFAPYSTDSWSRFLARLGQREGVFRLLVRKRRSTDESKRIYLSFYRSPDFFEEDRKAFLKTESAEVEVLVKSELGEKILKLWSDFEAGERTFGSVISSLDPEGFMRITARLAWEEVEGSDEMALVLKELPGIDWYGRSIQEAYRNSTEKQERQDDLSDVGSVGSK